MLAYSVIIPVYKVEHKLGACVESVLAQTFTDFEFNIPSASKKSAINTLIKFCDVTSFETMNSPYSPVSTFTVDTISVLFAICFGPPFYRIQFEYDGKDFLLR